MNAADFTTALRTFATHVYNTGTPRLVINTLYSFNNVNQAYYDFAPCNPLLAEFNTAIHAMPAWAAAQGYGSSFIKVADIWTAFGGDAITTDYVTASTFHPTALGSQTMADAMSEAALCD